MIDIGCPAVPQRKPEEGEEEEVKEDTGAPKKQRTSEGAPSAEEPTPSAVEPNNGDQVVNGAPMNEEQTNGGEKNDAEKGTEGTKGTENGAEKIGVEGGVEKMDESPAADDPLPEVDN